MKTKIFSFVKFNLKKIIDKIQLKYVSFFDDASGTKTRKYYKKIYNIEIGKYTYGYKGAKISNGTKIGSFCSIAPGVKIGLMNHPLEYVSTNPFLYYKSRKFIKEDKLIFQKKNPIIEDDVWIGTDAIILPGVTIHKGAVVGANAVITKDVPAYAIVAGVPAKVIRYRFDEKTRNSLLNIDWCNWDDHKISEQIDLFYNSKEFIEKNESENGK